MPINSKEQYIFVSDPASGGINSRDDTRELNENESPYILNMDIGNKGKVITRFGYELWGDLSGSVGTGFRGSLPFYRTYDTNSGDYFLTFNANGTAYKSTNASPTPSSIGSYGTDSGPVRSIVFNNLAIYGNGLAANTPQKWAGTGSSANLGGTPPDANVWGVINKSLCAVTPAAPSVMNISDINDPEDWTTGIATNTTVGALGDGEDVTAIIEANDSPIVFKQRSKHIADLTFDGSDVLLRIAFKEKKDRSSGAIATGSVISDVNSSGEVVYYLSENGFKGYGALENFNSKRDPADLSAKISNTVAQINFAQAKWINSEKTASNIYWLAPFGAVSQNNSAFVFNKEFQSWTFYNGMPFADVKNFRDTDGRNQLMLVSNNEAKIYKVNRGFSDNGFGYDRAYRSKTWTFGNRLRWKWLDFTGVKTLGSTVYINIVVDTLTYRFKVTDSNLMQGAGGGYIGDNYIGQAYTGGGAYGSDIPLYRWKGRAQLPNIEGLEIYFTIYNNADGEGWGLNSYGVKYDGLNAEVAFNPRTVGEPYLEPI